jgi:hypothetical protein
MHRSSLLSAAAMSIFVAGCSPGSEPSATTRGDQASTRHADANAVVVYKSPSCGCCSMWAEHMKAAGFDVQVKATNNMEYVEKEAGVPPDQVSCHTALVGRYFIEGHVPAEDVRRLLAEQPEARGLVVPGMVAGSPGMEQGGVRQPYAVLLVAMDGSTSVYARHNE